MSLQRIVRNFKFIEENRLKLTFSDSSKVFLDSKNNKLTLRPLSFESATQKWTYSTDSNLYVTVSPFTPQALTQWAAFSVTPRPTLQPDNTQLGYKINNGTDDLYWDGANWSVAGLSDWNTEQEVSANIETYPVTSKVLSVIINLQTSDKYETPWIEAFDVLGVYRISYVKSIVKAFQKALEDYLRPQIEILLTHEGGNKVFLSRFIETPYNIVTVDEVFNESLDPSYSNNLYSSWDDTDKVITLTSSQDSNDAMLIRFTVEPEVAVNYTDQDYSEIAKLPAVVISSFELEGNIVHGKQYATNISDYTAFVRNDPTMTSLNFIVQVIAESNNTLLDLQNRMLEFEANNRLLLWEDLDQEVDMFLEGQGLLQSRANLRNRRATSYRVSLERLFLWLTPEVTKPLVRDVVFDVKKSEQ